MAKRTKQSSLPHKPLHEANYSTLDLHGYRRDAAIVAVTNFLGLQRRQVERQTRSCGNCTSPWVTIITGTGSHSPTGPVLRREVASLLARRQFDFLQNTPGSFWVHATSGEVWYSQQHSPVSTKLIVATSSSRHMDPLLRLQQINQRPRHQAARRVAGYAGAARR